MLKQQTRAIVAFALFGLSTNSIFIIEQFKVQLSGPVAGCSDGSAPLLPSSTTLLKYGTRQFEFKTADGTTTFQQFMASPTFRPASASDEALAEARYTPRPKDPAELTNWTTDADQYEGAIQYSPAWRAIDAPSNGITPLVHAANNFESGYAAIAGGYEKVVSHFVQPTISNGSNAAMLNWAGLESPGASNNMLLQAGTVNQYTSATVGSPFWETACSSGCPGGFVLVGSTVAVSGDDVAESVYYDPSANYGTFSVAVNGFTEFTLGSPLPTGHITGARAEFFTERVTGPVLRNVPNFANIHYNNARTYTVFDGSAFTYFGDQAFTSLEMVRTGSVFYTPQCSDTRILVYPVQLSSSSFYNQFCRGS